MILRTWVLVGVVLVVAGCSSKDEVEEPRKAEAATVQDAAGLPTQPADAAASDGATMLAVSADFDPQSVAETTVALPPFPFFKDPAGLVNDLQGPDTLISFDRHYFIAGDKIVAQEGRMGLFQYNLENPPSGRKWTQIEFMRNYDNAITGLGGKKINTVQYSPELVATVNGGRDEIEKFRAATAPADRRAEHSVYLIRGGGNEYWIQVSSGDTIPFMGFVTVLEKQGMKSSISFLDAAAMQKDLQEKGRVALYINFDTDKATLRPDAQPIMDEINKLLTGDPALKLSIEGHTDSAGGADHNRQLSTARARAVFGALVGLGVDPSRLASKGFGPDKPVADNANEEGRAKNRRVELVKTN
jgi:OmpA-OmpF porin, OOP family